MFFKLGFRLQIIFITQAILMALPWAVALSLFGWLLISLIPSGAEATWQQTLSLALAGGGAALFGLVVIQLYNLNRAMNRAASGEIGMEELLGTDAEQEKDNSK